MKTILSLVVAMLSGLSAAGAEAAPASSPSRDRTDPPVQDAEAPKPRETDSLLREFNRARQAYLDKRVQLQQTWRTLSESQRQALREQLKALREEQMQTREELRQRLQELRAKLPSHGAVIDQAREQTRERRREQ